VPFSICWAQKLTKAAERGPKVCFLEKRPLKGKFFKISCSTIQDLPNLHVLAKFRGNWQSRSDQTDEWYSWWKNDREKLVFGPFCGASRATSPKILYRHSFPSFPPSAKYRPNQSSFPRVIRENVFTMITIWVQATTSCDLLTLKDGRRHACVINSGDDNR